MNESLEYNLPKNAYVNFDAVSLKDFIIQRLNENPQFTDQNYEGSNLSSLIDIIAYSYHVLIFYLNQNSSESLFSQTSLYENMNKIVNLIGYKPTGKQTSLVSINCLADSNLPIGSHTLRKYSYFLVDKIQYTNINDFTFQKTTAENETIDAINNNLILYQGTVNEYPIYTADGEDYETFPIVVDNLVDNNDTRFIAHNTISVYVKEASDNVWREYTEVDSLFLSDESSRIYEIRLNENGHYEVKFGNNTFGRKLKGGDKVAVYYILSDNTNGSISKNAINGNKLFNYTSKLFEEIYSNVTSIDSSTLITLDESDSLTFSNPINSSPVSDAETVDDIRNNAPFLIGTNIRLVTSTDYEKFLSKTMTNVINSIRIVDNNTYIKEYIDYFYRICVDPNKNSRVLINQINFADSCDFNNVNIFIVPKFNIVKDNQYPPFLTNSFKNLIIDKTLDKKMLGHEIIPRDAVYVAFDFGFTTGTPNKNIRHTTKLQISRSSQSKINKDTLKKRVADKILEFFKPSNNDLGGTIDISKLTSNILNIEGVKNVSTINNGQMFNGVSFISWNPVYEGVDEALVTQTTNLPFFKFPYFFSPESITNSIEIIDR